MKKIVSFMLIFTMMFSFSLSVYADSSKNALASADEGNYQAAISTLEKDLRNIDYEKLETIAGDNLKESKDGTIQVQISDIKKYSEDVGISLEFAEIYLRETNKVLKHIQHQGFTVDRDGNIIDPNKIKTKSDVSITTIGIDEEGTIEMDPFHDRTFFGRTKTEQMLNNLDAKMWVFTGISLSTAFKWVHVSFIAAICAALTALEMHEISTAFRQSGYMGVRHDYWRIPAGPDGEEWNPWYRQ